MEHREEGERGGGIAHRRITAVADLSYRVDCLVVVPNAWYINFHDDHLSPLFEYLASS
jgi:hypothetical protein